MLELIKSCFDENILATKKALTELADPIAKACDMMIESYKNSGGVYVFGNGGSAADSQHIAGELVGRFKLERKALRAQALSTDTSILTCLANDYSYEMIFARQLEANARVGDIALGLSTSGNSANVLQAFEYAKKNGIKTIAITGQGGGKCADLVDCLIAIPSKNTPRVQEVGMLAYHIICQQVEAVLASLEK